MIQECMKNVLLWGCVMTFKLHKYVSPFLLIFMVCSRNPVEIDHNKNPVEEKTFYTHSLRTMIPDSSGLFWGLSWTGLYRIDQYNPDGNGNIAEFCSTYYDIYHYPYKGEFFYDDLKNVNMITYDGIFQIHSIDSVERIYSVFSQNPWDQLYNIDRGGRCWFVEGFGNTFSIRCFSNDSVVTLVTDTLTSDSVDNLIIYFSADSSFGALLFHDHRWNSYLNIYCKDILLDIDTLFKPEDFVRPLGIFWLEDFLYVLFEAREHFKFESIDTFYVHGGAYLIRRAIGESGWEHVDDRFHNTYYGSSGLETGRYLKSKFRSESEIWIYNDRGYLSVTSSGGGWTSFRDLYINNFNVHCFKNDTTVFFDEVTQDFINVYE